MLKPSQILKQVADHIQPACYWDWNDGLCGNIFRNFGNDAERLAKYWMRQRLNNKYSGNRVYPIPYDIDALHGRDIAYLLDYDDASNINLAQIAYHANQGDLYTGCYGKNGAKWRSFFLICLPLKVNNNETLCGIRGNWQRRQIIPSPWF